MNKLLVIHVKGNNHSWSFEFQGDPKYIKEWRNDGLEVYEIENTIPEFVVDFGLTRTWCFLQDIFHFKNPFVK